MPWRSAGFGLLLLASSAAAVAGDEKRSVPTYTNDDLERVSARRGETGVTSEVAARAPDVGRGAGEADAESAHRARSEAYWRRQADRHRDRLSAARERIEDLRARIAERESRPRRRGVADTQVEGWRRQLAVLEERVRDEEGRFADRARRAGALPGWLR
jgi:chromosome segregation ATPase